MFFHRGEIIMHRVRREAEQEAFWQLLKCGNYDNENFIEPLVNQIYGKKINGLSEEEKKTMLSFSKCINNIIDRGNNQ